MALRFCGVGIDSDDGFGFGTLVEVCDDVEFCVEVGSKPPPSETEGGVLRDSVLDDGDVCVDVEFKPPPSKPEGGAPECRSVAGVALGVAVMPMADADKEAVAWSVSILISSMIRVCGSRSGSSWVKTMLSSRLGFKS